MVRLGLRFWGWVAVASAPILTGLAYRSYTGVGYVADPRVPVDFPVLCLVVSMIVGFCGVLSSSLHYMLPRKRACEGDKTTTGTSSAASASSLIKKVRIGTAESAVNSSSSSNGSGSVVESDVPIMALGDSNAGDIDEDLHSRQLAVYGRETMRRLFASNVLISGIQGLGAEIAKNLILAGVKSVTLHDEGTVELWDLSSNFIFTEDDVGKNRALASVQKLQELNNAVIVHTLTTPLTKEQLSDFQGEPSFHLFGFLIVFAATAARALKSVLQGILLSSEGISNKTLNAGRRSRRNDLSSLAC